MSNFVVSARKYRPVKFNDVVGQTHVSQTLKNAFQTDHLAHAFLFCGPRGVGKTTCARILAKVLNCQNVSTDYEACNTCHSCQAFNENASFNITELDAASNNSVEHIRALIEQVRFQPQQGKYKVFIIDEVHMLSSQAFNAFLKTLEEPPSYAIFILATTEKHKIIPTILSRCQIFDFRRIQVEDMVAHLQFICEQEKITADKEALHIIAQKADGALRDALSIFDRIVSFSGKEITYEAVIENLNILDYDYFFKITDALLAEDLSAILLTFEAILKKGFEPDIFINGLAGHFRNILVCKDPKTLELLVVGETLKQRYQAQASLAPDSFLLTALSIANDCDINYKMARNKRLHTEMALIKMTYINRAVSIVNQPQPLQPATQQAVQKKSPDKIVTNPPASSPETASVVNEPNEEIKKKAPSDVLNVSQKPEKAGETTENEKKETPKLRSTSKYGIPTIGNLSGLEESVEEVEKEAATAPSVLNQENLQEAWRAYAAQSDSNYIKSYLVDSELRIEGEKITAVVASKLAKEALQQEKELIPTLRKKLNTPGLILEFIIDVSKIKEEVVVKRLLTDRDIFIQMRDINPWVDEMRKRFDLRPE